MMQGERSNMRLGLRCMGWVALGGLAVSIAGYTHTVAELEALARSAVVREVSMAAGLSLAGFYATAVSLDDLENLAETGCTVGIRLAARTAIDILSDPLQLLVEQPADDLKELAVRAATSDERLDAARAYYIKTRESLTAESLTADATESESEELALAAGEVLAGFYTSFEAVSTVELMEQAVEGASPGLRIAAGLALGTQLIRTSSLKEGEIIVKIMEHTMVRTELAEAYMLLLAHRWREDGGA